VTRVGRSFPRGLAPLAVLAGLFLLAPLAGLLARVPWADLLERLASDAVLDALVLSLQSSLAAALLVVVLGLPLAAWLASGRSSLRAVVRVLVTLPMVLPPVVGGVALLLAFGRSGLVGEPLARLFGVQFTFAFAGVVVAATYVALPFFVLTAESGLRGLDARLPTVAATLGASPWRVFTRVTLPAVAPALGAGLVLAWARALGEFGATITFAGNLEGATRTMPLAVHTALESDPEAAIVLSLLMVAVSAGLLFALRRRWFVGATTR